MSKTIKYNKLNENIEQAILDCKDRNYANRLKEFLKQKPEKYTYFEDKGKYFINSFFPSIPGEAYNRLVSGMNKVSNEIRVPLQADIVVTGKCHCKCWHCFRTEYQSEDMSKEKIVDCMHQLYEMGTVNIGITGGEPMLRPDILQIIQAIPNGMEGQLYTTGLGIDEKFAKELAHTRLTRCIISLDHYDEKIVCKARNYEYAFQNAVNACKALAKVNIFTTVTLCITEELLDSEALKAYMDFAKYLAVSEVRIVMQIPQGKLKEKNISRIYGQALKFIRNMQITYNEDESYPALFNFSEFENIKYFGCSAGGSYITINNDGKVTPCVAVPLAFGSVYKEEIQNIYSRMKEYFNCSNAACYGIASGNVIRKEKLDTGIPPLSYHDSAYVAEKCKLLMKQSTIFKFCKDEGLKTI